VAIECHVLTPLDTPEIAREILDEVDSPFVVANFDPVNFLGSPSAVYEAAEVARHAARTLAGRLAPAAHIKDVTIAPELVLHIEECAPGKGLIDTRRLLEVCRDHLEEGATLVVEHLGPQESELALRHVRACGARLGLWPASR
jgi:sugar phosphate isomerase/epimerase